MTNSIAKGYNSIAELPTEVRSSFDETDQEKWMKEYNSIIGDKTDEESIKQAREDAWMKMQDCPSGLSVETWGSVEVKDWDNEVVDIKSLEERCDTFIAHGGRLNDVHTNLPVGAVWKWEKGIHPETGQEGVKFWFNVYRDTETTERAREEILDGVKRSVSIGAEAPRGEYKCDEKGCYVERNVTDFYELSICEAPANPEANFIAINGENIAKSRHHNKGDMVFKLNEMTVHEDYTTCPIQNIKRNLIKSGIKDTHIGKDNHITTKGITRTQLLKVLKESDTTCKYRETSPGNYEIKVVKSVKKSDSAMYEQLDDMLRLIRGGADGAESCINKGDFTSAVGYADSIVESAQDLEEALINIRGESKSLKKSYTLAELKEHAEYVKSFIDGMVETVEEGELEYALEDARSLTETIDLFERMIKSMMSADKSVKKEMGGHHYYALHQAYELLENHISTEVYGMIDAKMYAPTTESFIAAMAGVMDDYQAQFRQSVKKDLFWSSDDGDNWYADGCSVEYNEDTDGYTAIVYGNGDSDKIVMEFELLHEAKNWCEDMCEDCGEKSVKKSSLSIYNLLAYLDERLDGNDIETLDYVLERNGVHSVRQLKIALQDAYDRRYNDEWAHKDDLTESVGKAWWPDPEWKIEELHTAYDAIESCRGGLGEERLVTAMDLVISPKDLDTLLYIIKSAGEIWDVDKSTRKMNKEIDPSADIQQYIDEAMDKGWAYESNKCVFFTKDVPEGFFKDQYERGNVQCISSYWGFRNDIVAKDK